jgi:hypothetical protein
MRWHELGSGWIDRHRDATSTAELAGKGAA